MVKKVNYPLTFLLVFFLVILGLVYTVSLTEQTEPAVPTTQRSIHATEKHTQQIKEQKSDIGIKDIGVIIDSVAINSPLKFTSPEKAEKNKLVAIAFWCILLSGENESYDFSDKAILINENLLEDVYRSLFEDTDFPDHKTIKSQGLTFTYNKKDGTYSVPITGITPGYTAEIVSEKEKGDKIRVKADLIPADKWTQDADGKIISPKAQRSMNVTLKRKIEGTLTILSVANK